MNIPPAQSFAVCLWGLQREPRARIAPRREASGSTEHASWRTAAKLGPQFRITHLYPNFPIFIPKGTPSFPPVCRRCSARNGPKNGARPADSCIAPRIFRPGNITWRQEVGGSAIEASKIAGHSDLEMTSEYTFVAPERQNELTRRIQQKLAKAATEKAVEAAESTPAPTAPEVPPNLAELRLSTPTVQ